MLLRLPLLPWQRAQAGRPLLNAERKVSSCTLQATERGMLLCRVKRRDIGGDRWNLLRGWSLAGFDMTGQEVLPVRKPQGFALDIKRVQSRQARYRFCGLPGSVNALAG